MGQGQSRSEKSRQLRSRGGGGRGGVVGFTQRFGDSVSREKGVVPEIVATDPEEIEIQK